jgi:hypothetical protein
MRISTAYAWQYGGSQGRHHGASHRRSAGGDGTTLVLTDIPGSVGAGTAPTLADLFAYLDRWCLTDALDFVHLCDCYQQDQETFSRLIVHARDRRDAKDLQRHLEAWEVRGHRPGRVVPREGGMRALRKRYGRKRVLTLEGPASSYDFRSFRRILPIEFFVDLYRAAPLHRVEAALIYPRRTAYE